MKLTIPLFIAFIIGLFLAQKSYAQADAQFSHSPYLSSVFNPSLAGSYSGLAAGGSFRSQWTLFKGQPFSQALYAHLPNNKLKGGVGLSIINDFAAAHRSTNVQLQYAFKKRINAGYLNAGIQAGLIQYSLYGDKLRASEGDYENGNLNHNDASLPTSTINAIKPDLGIGTSLLKEKYSVSLAINHLLPMPIKFSTAAGSGIVQYSPTLYFQTQFQQEINSNLKFTPSVFVKSDFKKTTVDIMAMAMYKKNMSVGVGFRGFNKTTADGVIFLFAYQIKPELLLAYTYDASISQLRKTSIGSNEIGLHYRFIAPPAPPRGKIIYSPRFL
jgi:type IX secretion system PorP/SprF family membrane protein